MYQGGPHRKQESSYSGAVQVQIESPRDATSRPFAISIEEVHDNEPAHASGNRPQVEEPDEGDPNLSQACLALLSKT